MKNVTLIAVALTLTILMAGCSKGGCVFEFRNLSSYNVVGLYMRPMGEDSWGKNLLDHTLEPGETLRFSLSAGCYDFGAIASNAEAETTTICFNLGDGFWWGVYDNKSAKSIISDPVLNESGVLNEVQRLLFILTLSDR